MAGTRSSARNGGNSSSPSKPDDTTAGSKRKPEDQPSPAREAKVTKKQTTLEDAGITKDGDSEMKDASGSEHAGDEPVKDQKDTKQDASKEEEASEGASKADDKEEQSNDTEKLDAPTDDNAVEESSQREKDMPSNILEKGLIYFFTRNRVGIDDAESVGDLQRTFFVLRPLPTGAKLGDGTIPDLKNNRLFALPKKVFPKSHNDRFMAFVEKANTTIQDLKDNFCTFTLRPVLIPYTNHINSQRLLIRNQNPRHPPRRPHDSHRRGCLRTHPHRRPHHPPRLLDNHPKRTRRDPSRPRNQRPRQLHRERQESRAKWACECVVASEA